MGFGLIAGAVIGGAVSLYGANKQADAISDSSNQAAASLAAAQARNNEISVSRQDTNVKEASNSLARSQESKDFQMKQYSDWKDIYGPIQESVGDYYKNLTGASISNQEVEQIQASSQEAMDRMNEQLAQRGMTGSGIEASMANQNIYSAEMQKAQSRSTADQRAADAKSNFLAMGLGQGQSLINSMNNTDNTMANTTSNLINTNSSIVSNQMSGNTSIGNNTANVQTNAGTNQAKIIGTAADAVTDLVGFGAGLYNGAASTPAYDPISEF